MNDEIYLKIYTEDDDKVLVFEGQSEEDVPHFYYPTRWDDKAHRIGTIVIGKEHIRITQAARDAFRKIIKEARKTGDDISCIDIQTCNEKEVYVSYLGQIVTKLNIEEVIKDNDFFIGTGEGIPEVDLLEMIPDL